MNYYPFNLGDYAAHTAHLEPMEDLAYRRMLDLYYMRGGALPADAAEVARLIRMKGNVKEVGDVLMEFFQLQEDGWANSRCDKEIAAFKAMADGGRKGAAKRWSKGSDSPPIATPPTPQCQPEPEPEPEEKQCTHTHPLAPDWVLPKAWGEWAVAEFPHWAPDTVRSISENFRDHWKANGGCSADWQASWQKWCRDDLTQKANRKPKAEAAPAKSANSVALKRQTEEFMAAERERDRLMQDPEERARIAAVIARRGIKAVA